MTLATLDRTVEAAEGWLLDPFGATPQQASRVPGLGGPDTPFEPGYVFRTLPTRPAPGEATFEVLFHELAATHGHLSIDLTVSPAHVGVSAIKLQTLVIPLEELIARGGVVELGFEARRNMLYGIAGYIHSDSDITARQIDVRLRAGAIHPVELEHLPERAPVARSRVESVGIPRLTDLDEPSFRNPTSQPKTREQCRHPELQQWASELDLAAGTDEDVSWALAFPLQVLSRYGVLHPGARGLGIGVRGEPLPAMLARLDCSILAVEQSNADAASDPGELLETLHHTGLCDEEHFYANVHCALIDLHNPELPSGFDFAWSIGLGSSRPDVERIVRLATASLAPGGLAIIVFPYAPIGSNDHAALTRADVERLALEAISHGHEVAQLKFRLPAEDRRRSPTRLPYGLIIQRA